MRAQRASSPLLPGAPLLGSPFLVGIAGGSGSGKSHLVRALVQRLPPGRCTVIDQDAYYRDLGHLPEAVRALENFDAPEAVDADLLAQHLKKLQSLVPVDVPTYDFHTHRRLDETREARPAGCIVVEGTLILQFDRVRSLLDLKLYVETDADTRLLRRVRRDLQERGRTIESTLRQWEATVRPMHLEFVEPSRRHADLILTEESLSGPALDLLSAFLVSRTESGEDAGGR